MNNPTTVQPFQHGELACCEMHRPVEVEELTANGVDEEVANDLYRRIVGEIEPEDQFAQAAARSFVDTVVQFTHAGCRLTSVR